MTSSPPDISSFDRDGYAVATGCVPHNLQAELMRLCDHAPEQLQSKRKGSSTYGVRQLLDGIPAIREIVAGSPFIDLAQAVLGPAARPVKGVFFDKTSTANWLVPWHQDVTITLREKRPVPDFDWRPASEGVIHALPPVAISEQMLTLRIHLDDAGADHGALRVIPGSHREGRLTQEQVVRRTQRVSEAVVSVRAGDIMLMRPLLLHASSPCKSPGHRRVVHIEYSATELPGGLQWAG